jgi:hypothetical protein
MSEQPPEWAQQIQDGINDLRVKFASFTSKIEERCENRADSCGRRFSSLESRPTGNNLGRIIPIVLGASAAVGAAVAVLARLGLLR